MCATIVDFWNSAFYVWLRRLHKGAGGFYLFSSLNKAGMTNFNPGVFVLDYCSAEVGIAKNLRANAPTLPVGVKLNWEGWLCRFLIPSGLYFAMCSQLLYLKKLEKIFWREKLEHRPAPLYNGHLVHPGTWKCVLTWPHTSPIRSPTCNWMR